MNDLSIPTDALVLVGDGRKALFLRNRRTPMHAELVVEQVLQQDDPPTRDQGTDQPGRYSGGGPTPKSAFEQTDWHQLGEDRFAAQIGATLNRMAHEHRFNHLILVAPPKTLGELRKQLHKEATSKVIAEIPEDLTRQTVPEIVRTLTAH